MESNIKLGRLFGIEIGVNYSWFIILLLINFLLWSHFKFEHPDWPASWHVALAIITSLLFFGSILAHELSHSLLALAKGLPVHSITLFVFGGVSRIEKDAMNAATEFWVGIIGPISSALISGLFWGLHLLVGDPSSPLGAMTYWLAIINLALAIFNMIPGFPLDGGRVLRAAVWAVTGDRHRATRVAAVIGQGFAYLFMLVGIALAIGAGLVLNGLWLVLIGWFLLDAARSTQQALIFERAMRGVSARDVMSADCPTVPGGISLASLLDDHIMRTGRRCFIVVDNGRLMGLITNNELKSVPRSAWVTTSIQSAMKPFDRMRWVNPSDDLRKVLEVMEKDDVNQVPVVSDGKLEGLIRRENLLRFLATRAEFDY